jgi:hypothetical protein
VWFILEFYITQILISTTSRSECIRRLIKVTDNNDARRKLEKKITVTILLTSITRSIFLSMVQQPKVGQDVLIIEASQSHSDTPHSVRLLCTSDQPVAGTST